MPRPRRTTTAPCRVPASTSIFPPPATGRRGTAAPKRASGRGTGGHVGPRLGAVAAAVRAGRRDAERHLALRAARGVDELDLDLGRQVRAATATGTAADEVVAEEGGKQVREAAEVEVPRLEAAAPKARVPVPVVQLAGLRVRERLVR